MSTEDRATLYALSVDSGETVAGPYVRGACQRHLNDLERSSTDEFPYYYDEHEAAEAIAFFEECLYLNGGQYEGKPFLLFGWQDFIVGSLFGWKRSSDGMRRFRVAFIETAKGPLSLDTPIATTEGWTTMEKIKPGDYVFNSNGEPTKVIAISPVFINRNCYRIAFSDGDHIIADSEHKWMTFARRSGMKPGPRKPGEIKKESYGIRSTEQIKNSLKIGDTASLHPQAKWNHRIDVAPTLNLPDIDLPLPPYSLGAWLGDGNSDDARLTVAYSDWQIVEEVRSEGIQVNERAKQSETTARVVFGGDRSSRKDSFQTKLRSVGLLENKHIPDIYFRAGTAQRLSLLQGIMDTDGHVAKRGHCEITLCNERLCYDVAALLRTLGYKGVVKKSDAKLNGNRVGDRWRISFQAYKSQPPVRLKRKVANLCDEPQTRPLSRGRMIVACDPVESVPVRCITVESDDHMFLAGNNLIPTCNSGKSPLCAGVGIKGLMADKEPRAEIYAAATFKDQAMVLFRDACAFYDQSEQLQKRLTASGVGEKRWRLSYPQANSFFQVIASDNKKGKSGPRPHMALLDEIHEHRDGSIIEMLRAGFKFRRQPMSFMITNSGHDKTSVCWEYHDMGAKVSLEQLQNDEFFAYICAFDEDDMKDDGYLDNEDCWIKVNPSLSYGLPGYEYIRSQVKEARGLPSKMSTVKRLCFCVWTEAENPAIDRDAWFACQDKDYPVDILAGRKAWGGLDLSAVRDLTAFALMFEPCAEDPVWRLKVWFWMPGIGISKKEETDHVPYIAWRDGGHIIAIDRKTIDYEFVIPKIVEICNAYNVQKIAFDRWKKKDFDKDVDRLGVTLPEMVDFGQGYQSMSPAIKVFETKLIEGTMRHDGNPCLTWCAANAVAISDSAENKKYDKSRSIGRIDGIVATVMACGILEEVEVSMYEGMTAEEIIEITAF